MKDIFSKYLDDDLWSIYDNKWERSLQGIRESQFAQGNGYLGSRGILEDIPYDTIAGTYIAGIYDRLTSQVSELVNFPNPFNFRLTTENGEKVGILAMDILEHKRILNMRKGLLLRQAVYRDSKNRRYDYQSLRFLSMNNKNIGVMQIAVTPLDGPVELDINTGIDTSVHNAGVLTEGLKKHFRLKELGQADNSGFLVVETFEKRYTAIFRSGFYYRINGGKKILAKDNIFKLKLKKNQTAVFTKICYIGHILSESDLGKFKASSAKEFRKSFSTSFDILIGDHIRAWERLWKDADIVISGTANLQKMARFNIYHMLICAHEDGGFSGIGARTLSGEGYRGHIFWDTDIFLLPFYAFVAPAAARNILLYRHKRMDAAREIAKSLGYKGVMFPWESAGLGEEEAPTWTKDIDGTIIKITTDKFEHHITADIAYAVYRYYLITHDIAFMRDYGYEILFETARFWASRVKFNKKLKKYDIDGVIGPDEFHEDVKNNAYTNMMAKWNLSTAHRLYFRLRTSAPEVLRDLRKKIDITDNEAKKWKPISSKIKINIKKDGLIEQFDGYFKLKRFIWTKTDENGIPLLPKKLKAKDLHKTQLVKQADVLMLLCILSDYFNKKTKKVNYDFYIQRTVHKSSLSPSIHSLMASECQDMDRAYRFFNVALRTDMSNLYRNTKDGIHAASLGGTWQALIYGFAGIGIKREVLSVDPQMPQTWNKLIFSLCWRGDKIRFEMDKDSVKIRVVSRKKKRSSFEIFGKPHTLAPNKNYSFERKIHGIGTEEYY
ncbi:MAG: glycoside hydrolase family 65 protein [Candidatus Omnitrophica bacterium]|nr:glycoside hydrolase family 65 protein [Candidatus Omnitrophota bacterium]